MNRHDVTIDPAILAVLPSETHRIVNLLPDEMIEYELRSQGLKPAATFHKRRKQLAKALVSESYKARPMPVGMPYRLDVENCMRHLSNWAQNVASSELSDDSLKSYLTRLDFLDRRRKHMMVPTNSEDACEAMECLRKACQEFRKDLIEMLRKDREGRYQKYQPTGDPNNWTLRENSLPSSTLRKRANHPEIDVTSKIPFDNNSLLDLSLGYHQGSVETESPGSFIRYKAPTSGLVSDERTFYSQPRSNANDSSVGKGKANIWKWNLKFHGDPHTMPVNEFIRRAKELARSRGATHWDLFDGAPDLFAGSALKWYRAGMETGMFRCWEELVAHLLVDFEGYDYGDNLLEYIKGRLQLPSERIVTYFATMEDLFIKLNRRVSEELKVKIIRRNLRAEFMRGLGFTVIRSVADLKVYCQALESDFRRIQSRGPGTSYKEPEVLSKSVRFTDRVNALETRDLEYESDYYRYEGSDNWRSDGTSLDMSFYNRHFDRSPRYSPRPQRDVSESYRDLSEKEWDRNTRELSIREEPNRPIIPVPKADFSMPPPASLRPSENLNQQRSYHAPLRSSNASSSFNHSGNEWGRLSQRAPQTPTVLRRPY